MRESIARVASAIFVVGLALSFFILSVPPALLPIYAGLFCLAVVPIALGRRPYKIFGILAILTTLLLAALEYRAGIRHNRYMERLRSQHEHPQAGTNATEIPVR